METRERGDSCHFHNASGIYLEATSDRDLGSECVIMSVGKCLCPGLCKSVVCGCSSTADSYH